MRLFKKAIERLDEFSGEFSLKGLARKALAVFGVAEESELYEDGWNVRRGEDMEVRGAMGLRKERRDGLDFADKIAREGAREAARASLREIYENGSGFGNRSLKIDVENGELDGVLAARERRRVRIGRLVGGGIDGEALNARNGVEIGVDRDEKIGLMAAREADALIEREEAIAFARQKSAIAFAAARWLFGEPSPF